MHFNNLFVANIACMQLKAMRKFMRICRLNVHCSGDNFLNRFQRACFEFCYTGGMFSTLKFARESVRLDLR